MRTYQSSFGQFCKFYYLAESSGYKPEITWVFDPAVRQWLKEKYGAVVLNLPDFFGVDCVDENYRLGFESDDDFVLFKLTF